MKHLILGLLFFSLSACLNPMKSIEPEIKDFKKEFPNNFQTYPTPNRQMHFAWSGDPSRPPILFVHGSPGSWQGWSQFLQSKDLQKNFHVLAVDRPGYGGSQKGEPELSLQKQAADIVASLKFNKSGKRAIVIGHSLGGPIVARMAIDHPEQISGLVLVAASVDPRLEELRWFQYLGKWFSWILPSDFKVCVKEIWPLRGELEKMEHLWSKIKAKTIIVHGEEDPLVQVANVDFMVSHLSPENLVRTDRIPELDHFIPWNQPDLIFKSIDSLKIYQ